MLAQSCIYFIMDLKKIDNNLSYNVIRTSIFDNEEMRDYYEYLYLFRFSYKEKEIFEILNSHVNSILNKQEYDKKCLKL